MVVLNRRELGRQQINSLLRGEKSRQRLRRGSPRDDSREERVANSITGSADIQKGVTLLHNWVGIVGLCQDSIGL